MRQFLACPSGRIASGSFSMLFFLAAWVAMYGKDDVYLYAMPWIVTLGIVGFIASVAFAIEEDPFAGMMQAILLPFAGGIYYAGMHFLMGTGAISAAVLAVMALAGAWAAAIGHRNWA